MTTTFTILGSIFSVIAVACYNLKHIYLGLLFAVLALICFAAALFTNFNKNKKPKSTTSKGVNSMDIIGKKVVVKIGGAPPEENPNEIVGEKTVVHVPDGEIGKYDRIVGVEPESCTH